MSSTAAAAAAASGSSSSKRKASSSSPPASSSPLKKAALNVAGKENATAAAAAAVPRRPRRLARFMASGNASVACTSSFDTTVDIVQSAAASLSAEFVADVTSPATVVVMEANKRTLRALFALARGSWLVSPEWVYKSVEARHWVDPAPFEITFFPAARQSRLHKEQGLPGLLAGVNVFVSPAFDEEGKFGELSQDVLHKLVMVAGAAVVAEPSAAHVTIVPPDHEPIPDVPVVVSQKWLFDSVSAFERLPWDEYLLSPAPDAAPNSSPSPPSSPAF